MIMFLKCQLILVLLRIWPQLYDFWIYILSEFLERLHLGRVLSVIVLTVCWIVVIFTYTSLIIVASEIFFRLIPYLRRKLRWILHGVIRYLRRAHRPVLPKIRFTHVCLFSCAIITGVVLWAKAGECSTEEALNKKAANLGNNVEYLRSQYRALHESVLEIKKNEDKKPNNPSTKQDSSRTMTAYSPPEAAILGIKNIKGTRTATGLSLKNRERLRLPLAFELMPHLLNDPDDSIVPAFQMSVGKRFVDIVIGVPTVKRDKESYLHITLTHLVNGMTKEQTSSVLIVVLVADPDVKYVVKIARSIENMFPSAVKDGLIDVIAPSPTYYPEFNTLRPTLQDSKKRTKWRSKHNLDLIFLMSYAQPRGTYYLGLEDDVVAKKDYIGEIKNFIAEVSVTNPDWLFIQFCHIGAIGKLFKSTHLLHFVTYVQLFYTNMPNDWLLESWLMDKVCEINRSTEQCAKSRLEICPRYNHSLFQHIGLYSSLRGKIQKAKDPTFGKMELFYPHDNPPLRSASCGVEVYGNHDLMRAYRGLTFFWGLHPKKDDVMEFWFLKATRLESFLLRSGNAEHVSDRLFDCVVEVLPVGNNGTYVTVGTFDEFGLAAGKISPELSSLISLRIRMMKNSAYWAILSEIQLTPLDPSVSGVKPKKDKE